MFVNDAPPLEEWLLARFSDPDDAYLGWRYDPRKARPGSLQQSLFPYHEAASCGWAHRGTTAMASISTRKSGFASPAT